MPEQLLGRIIRTCSNENEVVMDPFSGSASTLIVAKKLNRKFVGFELSEEYARAGTERLESVTAGDELTGAAEPNMSAPKTWQGKLNKRTQKVVGQTTKAAKAPLKQRIAETIDEGILAAWKSLKSGDSARNLLRRPTC